MKKAYILIFAIGILLSACSKDGKKAEYTGQYRLANLPDDDEEYGSIVIYGKFNLVLQ